MNNITKIFTVTILALLGSCNQNYNNIQNVNLLENPIAQDNDNDGFPDNYEIKNGNKSKLSIINKNGEHVLKFKSKEYAYVRIRSAYQTFKKNTKYQMTFKVKAKNLDSKNKSKKWMGNGLRVDIHNSNNIYNFAILMGSNVSTNGWIAVTIPFDTSKKPKLTYARVMVFFFNISGEVYIKDMSITKCPIDSNDKMTSFIMPDKTKIKTKYLTL